MHHRRPVFLLGFCLIFLGSVFSATAKTTHLKASEIQSIFNQSKYAGLHTAAKEFYLSEDEKLVIALCNLVRYDAKAFISEIIIPSGIDTSKPECSNLLKVLQNHKGTFPLMPAFSLYKSSSFHAKDMGASGQSGHHSSDGKAFKERIQNYFPSNTGFAENYYQGSGDPVDIVLSFLLEKGENGNEYRKNLLSENLHYIGISITPHRKNCTNAVLDFAQKPQMATASKSKHQQTEVYWRDCPKGTKISTRRKSGGFSFSSIFGGRRK